VITQRTIEKILDAAHIEDVVGDFVNLRRRGVSLIGLCPFHPEKTPSFNVTPSKNIFKCFGCGKGGDAITFLREHEGFSYPDALRWLAARYHIPIEETEERRTDDPEEVLKDQMFVAAQYARDFFVRQLWESDEGKSIGLSYFRERGFREPVIRKFDLGYAPSGGSTLAVHAVQAGYRPELLKQAGLMSAQGRDFFRDRVMFTIHSLSGKPVAFAGRIMGKVQGPKYINSPETPIYHKSNILYGLFQARQAIRKQDNCYLVEGYTDVLSLVQEGIENVVASSGTALTPEQIRLIRRFTQNLTILYDGDAAGLNAAMRGLELVLEQDMNVRVVMLPSGQDPDSYLAEVGREAFQAFLDREQQDFILFKTRMLLDDTREDPVARAGVIKEIVSSIARVGDALKRAEYTKVCADRLGVAEALLIREINQILAQRIEKSRRDKISKEASEAERDPEGSAPAPQETESPRATATDLHDAAQEIDLIRVLVSSGSRVMETEQGPISVAGLIFAGLDEEVLAEIPHLPARTFLTAARQWHEQGDDLSPEFFLHHKDLSVREWALRFLNQEDVYSENWEKRWNIVLHNQPMPDLNFERDARQALSRFHLKHFNRMCSVNARQIREASASGDEERLLHYLRFQIELQRLRNEVARDELNATILR